MELPFSKEQFFDVFRQYNEAVFPMQVIFYLLATLVMFFIWKKRSYSGMVAHISLSLLWLWIGIVYHIKYFSPINKAAIGFGILFIIQGILFAVFAARKSRIQYAIQKSASSIVGLFLITYALLIYQSTNTFLGHGYPGTPTFGLPCPTTIFTFGILLLAQEKIPLYLLVIPVLWSIIGFNAAISLDVLPDLMLAISALITTLLLIKRNRSLATPIAA